MTSVTRIKRHLQQEGITSTVKQASTHVFHRKIAPIFENKIQKRKLSEGEIMNICTSREQFFKRYDSAKCYDLEFPIITNNTDRVEKEFRERYPKKVQTEPPLVCEMDNVTVISPYAVPVSPYGYLPEKGLSDKNTLIGILSAAIRGTAPNGKSIFDSKEELDRAIFLVGPHDKNYYHWFNNYLPRLEGLLYYPKADETTVIVPRDPPQWQLDSLKLLGLSSSKIVEWPGEPIHTEKYILSRYRLEPSEEAKTRPKVKPKENYQWIIDKFHKNINLEKTSKSTRIYISREDATTRRTLNEDKVVATLSKYNFDKYTLSNLTLEEQIKLFHHADVIVGAHGAGLVNMMFSSSATVVELLGPKTTRTNPGVFYNMAQVFDHTYACIDAQSINQDICVDIEKLDSLVNNLLNSRGQH